MSIEDTAGSTRVAFGFERTTCDCRTCAMNCKYVPGFLIPADVIALYEHMGATGDPIAWAKEHLLASPGFLILRDGVPARVPTLVPARRADRSCKFLTAEDRCQIHSKSPYGCAFFDVHMSQQEANRRSTRGMRAVIDDWMSGGFYSQIWQALYEAALTNDPPEHSREQLAHALRCESERNQLGEAGRAS